MCIHTDIHTHAREQIKRQANKQPTKQRNDNMKHERTTERSKDRLQAKTDKRPHALSHTHTSEKKPVCASRGIWREADGNRETERESPSASGKRGGGDKNREKESVAVISRFYWPKEKNRRQPLLEKKLFPGRPNHALAKDSALVVLVQSLIRAHRRGNCPEDLTTDSPACC